MSIEKAVVTHVPMVTLREEISVVMTNGFTYGLMVREVERAVNCFG